uniref:Dual specificity protein phosphatase n=1 Tax=Globodera pallida TaxID=36090 RepID=A0A183BPW3_GLOPA
MKMKTAKISVSNVSEGIYLSSQDVAQDLSLLQRHGITHIVNAATGVRCYFPKKMFYLKLKLLDVPSDDVRKHFARVQQFMRKAIEKKGKVLVHCNAGISRSSALVLAYALTARGKRLDERRKASENAKRWRHRVIPLGLFIIAAVGCSIELLVLLATAECVVTA